QVMKIPILLCLIAVATGLALHAAPYVEVNWATNGTATQASTAVGGEPEHAIDGNTGGFFDDGSVTLNEAADDEGWWEVDLGEVKPIGRIHTWFRTLTPTECGT